MNHRESQLAKGDEASKPALTPDEKHRICLQLLEAGDLERAESGCRDALVTNRDHVGLLNLMGTVSLLNGNYDAAVEWISRALKQEPMAKSLALLATALQGKGMHEQAFNALRQAVALEPTSSAIWENFGHALDKAERVNEAKHCFLIARAFQKLPFLAECRSVSRDDWNALTEQFNAHLQNRSGMAKDLAPIHCLWSNAPLSEMPHLSLQSMIRQGHPVRLYTYDNVENLQTRVPLGVTVADAENVVPRSIYNHAVVNSDIRCFSYVFRYAALHNHGGWWLDTDIVLLKPLNFEAQHIFSAQWSGIEAGHVCVGNVMRAPKGSLHMANLYRMSLNRMVNEGGVEYGAVGPLLLSEYLLLSDDEELLPSILPPTNFNALDRTEVESLACDSRMVLEILSHPRVTGVHLWGKTWPDKGLRFGSIPDQSVLGYLKKLVLAPD